MKTDQTYHTPQGNLAGFDASQVEPSGFDPIPPGQYTAVIIESAIKPTKAHDGEYLELVLQILEGEHKGRRLWDRLNLTNRSETAMRIAQQALSAICRAVGILEPSDSSQLHDLPMSITVVCKPRHDTGEMANEVKGYGPLTQGATPAQSRPDSSLPPWKRR